jgi:hypothetical protein
MAKQQQLLLLLLLLLVAAHHASAAIQHRTSPRSSAAHDRSLQSDAGEVIRTELASGEVIGGLADFFPANSSSAVTSISVYSPNEQVELVMTASGDLELLNSTEFTTETMWKGRAFTDRIGADKFNSTMEMHVSHNSTIAVQLYVEV